jgi:DnaJ-like protein
LKSLIGNPKMPELVNSKPDYYGILGAREDASTGDIERLYKRQAHKRHPDRGGAEEDMKALNEAYHVLRSTERRLAYDNERQQPTSKSAGGVAAPAAREVGGSGQLLSALLCFILGSMLLFLVRFNGLWFLWPLSILATGVILFGVVIAHSAMTNARNSLAPTNPAKRFWVVQEIAFWFVVACGGVAFYLILTSIW